MKEIEKEILKAANDTSFVFKEEYWLDALAAVKTAERNNRLAWLFWLGLILITLTGFYLGFKQLNASNSTNSISNYNTEIMNGDKENRKKELRSELLVNNVALVDNEAKGNEMPESNFKTAQLANEVNSVAQGNQMQTPSFSNSPEQTSIVSGSGAVISSPSKPSKEGNTDFSLTNHKTSVTDRTNGQNMIESKPSNTILETGSISSKQYDTTEEEKPWRFATVFSKPLDLIQFTGNIRPKYTSVVSAIKSSRKKKFSSHIFLGTAVTDSYSGNGKEFTLPYAGLELRYLLFNHFSISLGGGYYSRNMKPLAITVSKVEYGFGVRREESSLNLEKSNWVEIPFKFSYVINENHSIGTGMSYSYLLSVKNSISSETTENGMQTNGPSELIDNTYLEYNSMYNNSWEAFAAYQFQWHKIGTEIRYYYGFSDILDDGLMKVSNFDRNNRLTFTIKYKLF